MFIFKTYAEFCEVTLRKIPRHILGMNVKIAKSVFKVCLQDGIVILKAMEI